MRIAIVSDVHGNLPALEAVVADIELEAPDLTVHGGDLVTNGPRPAEVLGLIRELGWPGILGNTDEALWSLPPALPERVRAHFDRACAATRELIGHEGVDWLRGLPLEWRGDGAALVHAAPGDLWRQVPADASDAELRDVFGVLGAGLAVYCHIHRPYVRAMEGLTVANSGSVSLPADGDWRAAYLMVEDGVPSVRRLEFDLERAVSDLLASDYPGAEALADMQRTGEFTPRRL